MASSTLQSAQQSNGGGPADTVLKVHRIRPLVESVGAVFNQLRRG